MLSQESLVSVVLPVRNGAATIKAAVESILLQTHRNFELLVIDDGSSDNTASLVDGFHDDRIRLIRQPASGIVTALNEGLKQSRGTFIARMDADDIAFPQRFEKQIRFLESRPGMDFCSCLAEYGGDAELQAGYSRYVNWINGLIEEDAIRLNRFVESPLAHPTFFFRRTLPEKHGAYRDGHFPEDYELLLRLMNAGVRVGKVPEVLLRWNDPPGRLSRTDDRYHPSQFHTVKAKYLAEELKRCNPHYPNVIVWGAGRVTRRRAELLEQEGIVIRAYLDFDQKKIDAPVQGPPRLHYRDVPARENCFVLVYVSNPGARDECRDFLESKGFEEGVHFLCCG